MSSKKKKKRLIADVWYEYPYPIKIDTLHHYIIVKDKD